MNAQMREVNDKWIRQTASFIAPNGYWCWIDENELFWKKGSDTKLTASTKKGLLRLRYVLSKECFDAIVNPVPEKYVPVKKVSPTTTLVMP